MYLDTGTPLLTAAGWTPSEPVPLQDLALELRRSSEFPDLAGTHRPGGTALS